MPENKSKKIRTIIIAGKEIPCYYHHTLVLGSGSAALSSAVRLKRGGIDDICILTDDINGGTSRNTGSDKQTYYKLSDSTKNPDSPFLMAEALMSGGAMHGDIALVEALSSENAFYHLVGMGVPFPHDEWGGYTGYKTDHDPRNRGTSLGPYTSKVMVEYLEKECRLLNIEIRDRHECIRLISYGNRIAGAVILQRDSSGCSGENYSVFLCDNMILGLGGPAGLFDASVFPARHTGGIGLALEIGAKAVNLTESQFGIASTGFRWNLSGSFQQVIPNYFSIDPETGEKYHFLNDHFPSIEKLSEAIFLKGYQWPFDPDKVKNFGSSSIDMLVYRETVVRNRDVYIDFRENPQGDDRLGEFSAEHLSEEVLHYWRNSGIDQAAPVERLQQLNPDAIELYKKHRIDLYNEPLKIAVCAQHNNGGLAGDIWWESVNIRHLFPVGEINGTHGVSRPGGSALNSGQVGALRAAEKIANAYKDSSLNIEKAAAAAEKALPEILEFAENALKDGKSCCTLKEYRGEYQKRMSEFGGMIRSEKYIGEACSGAAMQQSAIRHLRTGADRLPFLFRLRHMVLTQRIFLESIKNYIEQGGGSRGSYIILSADSDWPESDWAAPSWMKQDLPQLRKMVQTVQWDNESKSLTFDWQACRQVPEDQGWFEKVWSRYLERSIYSIREVVK